MSGITISGEHIAMLVGHLQSAIEANEHGAAGEAEKAILRPTLALVSIAIQSLHSIAESLDAIAAAAEAMVEDDDSEFTQ